MSTAQSCNAAADTGFEAAKQGEIDHVESSFVPREEYDLYL